MAASSHSKLPRHRDLTQLSGPDLKLFVKDVDDPHGRKRPLTVKTWATIKDVKDTLNKLLHVPPSAQRLYFGPLMTSGTDLPNHRTLCDAGIYRSGETLFLEIKAGNGNIGLDSSPRGENSASLSTLKSKGVNDVCISKSILDLTPKNLRRTIQQARRGLALGLKPELVMDGSGGTYFLHDARKVKIAVFKPADEEPYAENNPRGYVPSVSSTSHSSSGNGFSEGGAGDMSMRAGIKPGEACLREVAAYLLDHDSFSDVPMTTLAEARHPAFHSNGAMLNLNQGGASVGSHSLQLGAAPLHINSSPSQNKTILKKVGSLQEFVHGECTMDDVGPSKVSVEEVHKIAVLDIRTMNADRNTANLICRRNPDDPDFFELIPIDHGYCLRTVADVCWFDWCWLDWPQLKQPVSDRTREYILNLDIEEDARMLKERLQIPERALDYFRASSKLLQAGIRSGMTLYDIAVLCCRNDDSGELPSKLETLISMADDIAKSALDNGRWHHSAASRALEQQLTPETLNHKFFHSPSHDIQTSFGGGLAMYKSKSSVNFSSLSTEDLEDNNPPTPLALPSASGSDSSSDCVEEQECECDEWAAAFIADTLEPIDVPKPAASRRQRAISFARQDNDDSLHSSTSHDELSSSPIGFWYVPPSASKDKADNDSASWSPFISPAVSPSIASFGSGSGGIGKSLEMDGLELDIGKSRQVKFDMANLIPPMNLVRAASVDEDKLERETTDINSDGLDPPPPKFQLPMFNGLGGMRRSQSYSAFSSFRRITDDTTDEQDEKASPHIHVSPPSGGESTQQHRQYFHKFVDLLIDREITPKVRSRQISISINSTCAQTDVKSNSNQVDMNAVRYQLERTALRN